MTVEKRINTIGQVVLGVVLFVIVVLCAGLGIAIVARDNSRPFNVTPTVAPTVPTPTPTYASNWLPQVTPIAKRKTYVVETIPASWPVKSAAVWIDRYTGSDWVMARKCPSGAYRCIFVKRGNLPAPRLAETRNATGSRVTIVVDLAYANPRLSTSMRRWVMAHEFGHAAGLTSHSTFPGNLMYPNTKRGKYGLSASQRVKMAGR